MKQSAGILLYKVERDELFVFLAHPGGPLWKNKDDLSWTIPKGEFSSDEIPLTAAIREFEEETGTRLEGKFIPLSPVKLKSGKVVFAWAVQGEIDSNSIKSNEFSMEWPPKSGKTQQFPEIDKAAWFPIPVALEKINSAQAAFITELQQILKTI